MVMLPSRVRIQVRPEFSKQSASAPRDPYSIRPPTPKPLGNRNHRPRTTYASTPGDRLIGQPFLFCRKIYATYHALFHHFQVDNSDIKNILNVVQSPQLSRSVTSEKTPPPLPASEDTTPTKRPHPQKMPHPSRGHSHRCHARQEATPTEDATPVKKPRP